MNGTQVIHTELISYRINYAKLLLPAAVVGGGALVLAFFLGSITDLGNFAHAYLGAYLFWFGLSFGCLVLTMLHHLTGGRWGDVTRPLLESGIKTLPVTFVLGLPILFMMKWIYPWTQPLEFQTEKMRHQAAIWMNIPFFTVRYFVYFAIFGVIGYLLLGKYKLRDEMAVQDPEHNSSPFLRTVSAPGLVVAIVTLTMCQFDWGMSVQAGWYSTIYGLLALVGAGLTTWAFMMITLYLITRQYEAGKAHGGSADVGHPLPTLVAKADWHDLGNLMLTFTMLWGYMSLSQMLITYAGHLPSETVFYNYRSLNGWQYVGGFLIALQWVLPFCLLLMRGIKRDPNKLVFVALIILVVRQLDFYYQIHPSYTLGLKDKDGVASHLVTAAVGMHTLTHILCVFGIGWAVGVELRLEPEGPPGAARAGPRGAPLMSTYERKYPEAPTAEEIKTGYAPSTIKGSPFAKFLIWTFVGLAVTYAVTYGVIEGLDAMEKSEQSRFERMSARRPAEFKGPPLQPSVGHPNIDWLDTLEMYASNNAELVRKKWDSVPTRYWKTSVSPFVVQRTAEGIQAQRRSTSTTKPTALLD